MANSHLGSTMVGFPAPGEGSSGDIQLRLDGVPKMFSKLGATWYQNALFTLGNGIEKTSRGLSMEVAGKSVANFGDTIRLGKKDNDISRLEFDKYGNFKIINRQSTTDTDLLTIASGGDVTIGELAADKANVYISGGEFHVRKTVVTKLKIDGDGIISTAGKIIMGKKDGTWGSNDSVVIGSDQNDNQGLYNVLIGPFAGAVVASGGVGNTCAGYDSGKAINTGTYNTCIGGAAGDTITDGDFNVIIGVGSDVTGGSAQNQIAIGRTTVCTADNTCSIGNADITAILPGDDGGVNLGSASRAYDAVYADDGAFNGSDRRIKEDITSLSLGLEFINKLNPVSFKKKDKDEVYEGDRKIQRAITYKRKHTGLIAQEVKEAMDDMEIDANDFAGYVDANIKDGVDKLFLRYEEFIAPLIKAVQELSEEINNLKEG